MPTDEQTMTTDQAVEAIRAASFEAPKAHSHTEWAARIRAVLAAHARNVLPGAAAPPAPTPGGFGMFSAAGETLIERLVEALLSGIGEGVTAEQIVRAVEHIQDAASDLGHSEAHDTEVRWAIFRRLASAAVSYEALRAEWLRAPTYDITST